MGLKRLRQDKMVPLFMEQLKKDNWYEDRDVLNVCCYPLIKTIPLKYNLFLFYLGTSIKFLYELPYGRQDFDHDVPYILHIGGAFKAWDDIQKYDAYIDKCVVEPDKGIFDAMNKGISMATGDIIAFLNSNDWYEENALSTVMAVFMDSDCDCVCCDNYVLGKMDRGNILMRQNILSGIYIFK